MFRVLFSNIESYSIHPWGFTWKILARKDDMPFGTLILWSMMILVVLFFMGFFFSPQKYDKFLVMTWDDYKGPYDFVWNFSANLKSWIALYLWCEMPSMNMLCCMVEIRRGLPGFSTHMGLVCASTMVVLLVTLLLRYISTQLLLLIKSKDVRTVY